MRQLLAMLPKPAMMGAKSNQPTSRRGKRWLWLHMRATRVPLCSRAVDCTRNGRRNPWRGELHPGTPSPGAPACITNFQLLWGKEAAARCSLSLCWRPTHPGSLPPGPAHNVGDLPVPPPALPQLCCVQHAAAPGQQQVVRAGTGLAVGDNLAPHAAGAGRNSISGC